MSQSVSCCSSAGGACAAAADGLDCCGCSSSAEWSDPYPVSLSSPPTLRDDVDANSGIGLLSMMEKAMSSDLCGEFIINLLPYWSSARNIDYDTANGLRADATATDFSQNNSATFIQANYVVF